MSAHTSQLLQKPTLLMTVQLMRIQPGKGVFGESLQGVQVLGARGKRKGQRDRSGSGEVPGC